MSKLDAALNAAASGFSVFPLSPNSKIPPAEMDRWQFRATTDPTRIREWWTRWPDANIAAFTGALLVVDIDPRKGGRATFEALTLTEDFPKTRVSATAGGGNHLIYALPDGIVVHGGTDKLGPGVDVKSWGGYIVLPGSTIDNKPYEWMNDRPPAIAPQWMIEACGRPRQKAENAGERIVEADDTAHALAEAWLRTNAAPVPEGGRDNAAFKVAARLYDFGVDDATAAELLADWNAVYCSPPLEPGDIARVARSARDNRQSPIGTRHPDASGFEPVDIGPRTQDTPSATGGARPRGLHYITLAEGAGRALTHSAEPLVDGIIDCETMSVVYGESNSGKSFQEMDKDFHIATGLEWAGRAVKQGGVLWVAAEGGAGVYKRLAALKQHYDAADVPFFIVPCPVNLLRADADVKPLIELIRQIEAERGVKVVKITLDTLSRVIAGGDENSSVDMGKLVHHFDAIRAACKAHLAVIHHTGKDKAKGARGHSLLRAATDTEIEIDARTITVTKQRDLDGDVAIRFRLMPIDVGVDARGRTVTSCWVDTGAGAEAHFDVQPTRTEKGIFVVLCMALHKTNDKSAFDVEFLRDACRSFGLRQGIARSTLVEHCRSLSEKGWLKNPAQNQYLRTCRKLSDIDGFEKSMLSDFFGSLTAENSDKTDISSLAKAEGLEGAAG